MSQQLRRYINPILIGLSPVTIITGIFVIPINGFLIGIGITSTIFLQSPVKEGGYGFSPSQNAACSSKSRCLDGIIMSADKKI